MMIEWLWRDFLRNTDYFTHDYLWLHCLLSVVGVYGVCTILELLRFHVLEKPIFVKWNKCLSDKKSKS